MFQLTWADLYFAAIVDSWTDSTKINILEDYSSLQHIKNTVFGIPQIKTWVETRPDK